MRSGFLYVLVHPSHQDLYKIGVTVLEPAQRLAQHNRNFAEYAGKIVKSTGQEWEIKTYIAVPDVYWAEKIFWTAVPQSLVPFRRGIEIEKMEWKYVQLGLEAASKAGVRPKPPPRTVPVRNREWFIDKLKDSGIVMIGHYRGLLAGVEFQCENGHFFKNSPGVVANRRTCPICENSHEGD